MEKTVVVEVNQGIVTNVYGLPEGWSYTVVDFDVFEVEETDLDGRTEEDYCEIIRKARERDAE